MVDATCLLLGFNQRLASFKVVYCHERGGGDNRHVFLGIPHPEGRPYFLINIHLARERTHQLVEAPSMAISHRHCGEAGLPCLQGRRRKSEVGRKVSTRPWFV